ncbi:MAG: nucleotidyltransferase family protein [Gemmatimonadota bacterium]
MRHSHQDGRSESFADYAESYVRRAVARERERLDRRQDLEARAKAIAEWLRQRYGKRVRVLLFGSLVDPDRFAPGSDIDLAVEGLSPTEYWEAWGLAEERADDASLDFVRMESASRGLREVIRAEGRELP